MPEKDCFVYPLTSPRKHWIMKGKRRDTSWFSMIDDDWPTVKKGFETWLSNSNFDENGRQKRGLKECREN